MRIHTFHKAVLVDKHFSTEEDIIIRKITLWLELWSHQKIFLSVPSTQFLSETYILRTKRIERLIYFEEATI